MKQFTMALALLLVAGCATPRPDPTTIDWNARLGSYSYDEAVAEFGTPEVTGESAAGRFAEWILNRRPRMSFGVGVGTGSYGSHGGVGMGVGTSVSPPPRGDYLRLAFDGQDLLSDWATVKR